MINGKLVCEQAHLCEFGVALAVHGATSASWQEEWVEEKRACRRAKFLFLISPLKRFQVLSNRKKKIVNKNNRKLHQEILRQIAKYSHIWKKGKKAATKPADQANDSCRICKYFFDVEYGIGMENRSIFIACFAGSR